MRPFLLFVFLIAATVVQAQNPFEQAYSNHPTIPPGVLEAVAWTNTRMNHLENQQESCAGYPQAYGIMGLHDNGLNYFLENGKKVEILSGISIADQKSSATIQVEAYAKALEQLLTGVQPEEIKSALFQLSEIPDSGLINLLARDMQVYEILKFMNDPARGQEFGFTSYHFDLPLIFGYNNYQLLSSEKIEIAQTGITGDNGVSYMVNANASTEYGPAIWNPAASCNFSSRSGTAIEAITIHTIQGTYAGAISWAQNCASSVSYHYVIRSSDGQVTQMVLEADKAWHVGTENPYTIGYEHEGYVDDPIWYTEAMYNSSADLSRDIVNSGYGIPPLRTYYGDASASIQVLGGCTKIKGHQHYPNQTHTDPGIYWDWEKYYQLINNNPLFTTITNTSGTLTDTGGIAADYGDDEREFWLIQPPNTESITVDFTSFNLETNYDYMFIYDGDTLTDPLIGQYTATNSPGTLTSSGGSLLIEFRSDCATTAPGWEANFTTVPLDIFPPSTSITAGATWQTNDFIVDFMDTDNESSIKERFYLVSEKTPSETTPYSDGNYGFANEGFGDNDNNWLPVTGTYSLQTETYVFTDTSEQNSNTYLLVTQDNSSEYLYEWYQTITSAASNQRAGIHFFCDDPNQSNRGNSYFVYLRANSDLVQIYSVTNNTYTLEADSAFIVDENITYNCRVHYDPTTGWIRVFIDGTFVAEWQDLTPLQSGNSISLRTGGCEATFDNIRVYKSRGTQVTIPAGFGDLLSIESEGAIPTGFVYSIVSDSLDNWSTIDEETYLLDFSVPEIIELNDGPVMDIDTFTTSTIEANWSAQDIHSDIQEYEIAIGTLPNLDDVVSWTSNGLTETFSHVLSNPIYNQVYHISIRAYNQAGLDELFVSNGQRYIDDLGIDNINLEEVILYPNPSSTSVQFKGISGSLNVLFYDLNGKLCQSNMVFEENQVDISNLSKGKYQLVIQAGSAFTVKELIVVE